MMLLSSSEPSKSCSMVGFPGHSWNCFRCSVIVPVSSALQTILTDVLEAVFSMALSQFPTRVKVEMVLEGG